MNHWPARILNRQTTPIRIFGHATIALLTGGLTGMGDIMPVVITTTVAHILITTGEMIMRIVMRTAIATTEVDRQIVDSPDLLRIPGRVVPPDGRIIRIFTITSVE